MRQRIPHAFDMSSARREQRFMWFAEGYAVLRPLPAGVLEATPRLLTLVLARKVARVLRAHATTCDDACPAWLATMRSRHQQWLAAKRAALIWE